LLFLLGAGALLGGAVLHLIPAAFGEAEVNGSDDHNHSHGGGDPLGSKDGGLLLLAGYSLFFLLEAGAVNELSIDIMF
jgi:hypothetical protein